MIKICVQLMLNYLPPILRINSSWKKGGLCGLGQLVKSSWKRRRLGFTPAEWLGFEVIGMGGEGLSGGHMASTGIWL